MYRTINMTLRTIVLLYQEMLRRIPLLVRCSIVRNLQNLLLPSIGSPSSHHRMIFTLIVIWFSNKLLQERLRAQHLKREGNHYCPVIRDTVSYHKKLLVRSVSLLPTTRTMEKQSDQVHEQPRMIVLHSTIVLETWVIYLILCLSPFDIINKVYYFQRCTTTFIFSGITSHRCSTWHSRQLSLRTCLHDA
jgi:hypothetical protein